MSRPGGHPHSRSRSRSPDSHRRRDGDRSWMKRSRSRSGSPRSRSRSRSPRGRPRRAGSPPFKRPVTNKDPKFLNSRVFVANLASDKATEDDLRDLFSKHGKVIDALVHPNGYGFVQFSVEEEGRIAVDAVTGTVLHGKRLKCNMAAEGGKRGGAGRGGGGGGPPGDNRFGGEPSQDPDAFGPPYGNPYARGSLLPNPRDLTSPLRDLPPPPRDLPPPPRDLPLPHRDLPPPPRDPYFDDPYRRPVIPDPYYDRIRDDPYRRAPFEVSPFRDPYRDPYASALFEPVAAKKPVTVDCEIIIMATELRPYADMIERRLKNINLLTKVLAIREDFTIQQQVEEATRRSCLFAIVINSQNEMHRSLTLNILHGVAQEHRNMPMDDALSLVARSFEKFLQAEKEKLRKGADAGDKKSSDTAKSFLPPPKDIVYLLNLLADNRQVTLEELDKVMTYLKERKDRMLAVEGVAPSPPAVSSVPQQPQYSQEQLQQLQLQKQQQLQLQQQQHEQHKEYESKILSMMNGSAASTAVTQPSLLQSTLGSRASVLISSSPQQASSSHRAVTSPPSVSAVKSTAPAATLINFDNPTVQKALDNLIQSGPNLLKKISHTGGYPPSASSSQRQSY